MYRISELAEQVGLSRTTLLYYEKLGLIEGKRLGNGYRIYGEYDVQRLRLIQQLHAGGLTLNECKACLNARIDRQVLLNRLSQLDDEIAEKQSARRLLAALLGETGHKEWHETIDRVAPDVHLDWLIKQGFNEKEALRLKWLSKNMNEHERYMADFLRVYEAL
ncbi:MerR family transcriptional regulator, partial [Pontibacterium sp.]|uniref:MerR family transcriptional regulator n=1 Tax=Pontibacterium sp. TaxID=2036026 RepID=UPI003569902D